MAVKDVGFQNFKSVGDDQVCLAFPFRTVGGAAPAMGVSPGFKMLVECEVVQTKINPATRTEVEFDC